MPSEITGSRPRKSWLVSPAIATLLFFAAQLLLAIYSDKPQGRMAAASTEAPQTVPVHVRVVSQIRSAEDGGRALASVPQSEEALIELFKKRGWIVFSASEVETVDTQEASFDTEEVGVIKARQQAATGRLVSGTKLRPAQLAR
jgi:hypothetical protein